MPAHRPPSLSQKEQLILDLLAREGELYGLQLVSLSRRRLNRGTVYVTLGRMEAKGYIKSWLEDAPGTEGSLPRRVYEPTALGRRVLKAWTVTGRHLDPAPAR